MHTATRAPLMKSLVAGLRARADRRARHQTLVRELSHYRTPHERAELDAMLDRGRPEQVAELRKIVSRQRSAA